MSVYLFGVRRPALPFKLRTRAYKIAKAVATEHNRELEMHSAEGQTWFAASPQLGAPFDDALASDVKEALEKACISY